MSSGSRVRCVAPSPSSCAMSSQPRIVSQTTFGFSSLVARRHRTRPFPSKAVATRDYIERRLVSFVFNMLTVADYVLGFTSIAAHQWLRLLFLGTFIGYLFVVPNAVGLRTCSLSLFASLQICFLDPSWHPVSLIVTVCVVVCMGVGGVCTHGCVVS